MVWIDKDFWNDEIVIQLPNGAIKLSRAKIDEAWNRIVFSERYAEKMHQVLENPWNKQAHTKGQAPTEVKFSENTINSALERFKRKNSYNEAKALEEVFKARSKKRKCK